MNENLTQKGIEVFGGYARFLALQELGELKDIEPVIEEINLMYVAITRARESADLSDIEEGETIFSGDKLKVYDRTNQPCHQTLVRAQGDRVYLFMYNLNIFISKTAVARSYDAYTGI